MASVSPASTHLYTNGAAALQGSAGASRPRTHRWTKSEWDLNCSTPGETLQGAAGRVSPGGKKQVLVSQKCESQQCCTVRPYLLLDAVELHHLDDERGGAAFVLDGPQQSPHVVHAEGLRPAPVAPALNADVQQLQGGERRRVLGGGNKTNGKKKNTEDTRHQRL